VSGWKESPGAISVGGSFYPDGKSPRAAAGYEALCIRMEGVLRCQLGQKLYIRMEKVPECQSGKRLCISGWKESPGTSWVRKRLCISGWNESSGASWVRDCVYPDGKSLRVPVG
jgi:hypothetical protein